jgi:hypothetical protein
MIHGGLNEKDGRVNRSGPAEALLQPNEKRPGLAHHRLFV